MRRLAMALVFVTLVGPADAQDDLVAKGARVQKLAEGFRFTEGPAVDATGDIYFSDIPNSRIHRWSMKGKKVTVYRENTGRANGLFFDRHGNLLACEGGNRRLVSISPKGKVTALAAAYGGKKLNSPNDLWIDPSGGIYFTDPRYGRSDDLEQDGMHVYYVSPDRKRITRVAADLVRPNGIIGTTDGKTLYIADHGASKTWRYTIGKAGALSGKTLFAASGSDGMTLDEKGNVYLTGRGVEVYDPKGKKLATLTVPERPANVCFGGPDRRTLFITARRSLYSLRMAVRGADSAGPPRKKKSEKNFY